MTTKSGDNEVVSYCARWVVPIDRPPIEDGCVVVRGERIVAVGPGSQVAEGRRIDLRDSLLTPGFVNAHTHLEFSGLAAPLGAPGLSFPEWILHVLEYRRAPQFDAEKGTLAGLSESVRHGTTTLGEIASCVPRLLLDEASTDCDVTAFVELIGLSEVRAEAQRRLLGEFVGAPSRAAGARLGVSPHAPYTVRPNLLEATVKASAAHRLPLAFHLAESQEELRLLAGGDGPLVDYMRTLGVWDAAAIPRGTRPLDYLRAISSAHRALIVHGNYLADDEIDFLAGHADRMTTVYCPRTHAYFNHAPHPLPKLLERGAAAALGTDGRCTNPDLDLLAEMRLVAQTFPQLAPQRVLQLGTLDGARALGLAEEVGSLTPGKRADLLAFETSSSATEPCTALLHGPAMLQCVVHRGRQVTFS